MSKSELAGTSFLSSVDRDRYGGITVCVSENEQHRAEFTTQIGDILSEWQSSGVRGCWFSLQLPRDAPLIPVLIVHHFVFHFARADLCVLKRWLPDGEPNMLPEAPHYNVGAGGLVLHPDDPGLMLTICERVHKETIGMRWKLPGGLVDVGETIIDGARREVLEETGVRTDPSFSNIVLCRDRQDAAWGYSDLYCVVLLRATSVQLIKCELEVGEVKWAPIEELAHSADTFPLNSKIFAIAKRLSSQIASNHTLSSFSVTPYPAHWNDNLHDIWLHPEFKPLLTEPVQKL